jgi:hypothetical protein
MQCLLYENTSNINVVDSSMKYYVPNHCNKDLIFTLTYYRVYCGRIKLIIYTTCMHDNRARSQIFKWEFYKIMMQHGLAASCQNPDF